MHAALQLPQRTFTIGSYRHAAWGLVMTKPVGVTTRRVKAFHFYRKAPCTIDVHAVGLTTNNDFVWCSLHDLAF